MELKTPNQKQRCEKTKKTMMKIWKYFAKLKKNWQNFNKEQNQQLKRLLAEKDQHANTILNAQSTNNELEQQVTSLKRINLEFYTTVHFLEK